MSGALLVAGTHSDAGKSVVVAGICRWLAREGVSVAPFKAQNMALNSFVTREGAEIGRAQAAQAAAAMVEPEVAMNPILLKPSAERTTQVVVRGRPWANASARSYGGMKKTLMPIVLESLGELRRRFDVVVCEGAGSPAEINLRQNDLANMGLARAGDLPVLLVGDIDRGGLFASLYGTLALLSPEDQSLVCGFLVNKFRGDPAVLAPGLERMTSLTGRPFLGTLPWIPGLGLDGEDSLALDAPRPVKPPPGRDVLRVVVAHLERISNFTDFDALAHEPGISVRFTESAEELLDADLAILPGTKATVEDLKLLRSRGIDRAFATRAERGLPTLGICGGYQMLGGRIEDGVESADAEAAGLGLLPIETYFEDEKVLGRPEGQAPDFGGTEVEGYEIHHGRVRRAGGAPLFEIGADSEGCRMGATLGTSWHGVLESDGFRRALLLWVAGERGLDWRPGEVPFAAAREAQLEKLGDLVADHVDREALLHLVDDGACGAHREERGGVSATREPREKRLRRRSSRERPLLIVNTGYGKGKSTASFGVMLRGWARGYRIGVYQFVKSSKWNVGEQKAAEALGNIDWFKQGDGWTWTVKDLEHSADLAREGWEEVKRRLADETYDMLLLDEFTYPMKFGWVDTNEVVEVLKNRPGFQHVIITGRDAPPELVEISDLVSEINKVKHPFDEGYRGQKGIEW